MTKLEQVRQALADYMYAEGCSCCRDIEAHAKAKCKLGNLLGVPAEIEENYENEPYYDFSKYRTPIKPAEPKQLKFGGFKQGEMYILKADGKFSAKEKDNV